MQIHSPSGLRPLPPPFPCSACGCARMGEERLAGARGTARMTAPREARAEPLGRRSARPRAELRPRTFRVRAGPAGLRRPRCGRRCDHRHRAVAGGAQPVTRARGGSVQIHARRRTAPASLGSPARSRLSLLPVRHLRQRALGQLADRRIRSPKRAVDGAIPPCVRRRPIGGAQLARDPTGSLALDPRATSAARPHRHPRIRPAVSAPDTHHASRPSPSSSRDRGPLEPPPHFPSPLRRSAGFEDSPRVQPASLDSLSKLLLDRPKVCLLACDLPLKLTDTAGDDSLLDLACGRIPQHPLVVER